MVLLYPLDIYATACSKSAKKDLLEMFADYTKRDIPKLEKLYQECNDNSTRLLLHLSKGDIADNQKNRKKAFVEYKEALNALNDIEGSDQKRAMELGDLGSYLFKQLVKHGVVEADEIKRGYISRDYDRGGDMVHAKKMRALPLNFRTDSDVIESGVNLKQAHNIGEALSSDSYRGKAIYIRGFADTRGANSHNIALAQRRADSLKSYLKSEYNLDNIIVTENSGESLPICSKGEKMPDPDDKGGKKCSIREDYYASRRVEMTVGGR